MLNYATFCLTEYGNGCPREMSHTCKEFETSQFLHSNRNRSVQQVNHIIKAEPNFNSLSLLKTEIASSVFTQLVVSTLHDSSPNPER